MIYTSWLMAQATYLLPATTAAAAAAAVAAVLGSLLPSPLVLLLQFEVHTYHRLDCAKQARAQVASACLPTTAVCQSREEGEMPADGRALSSVIRGPTTRCSCAL